MDMQPRTDRESGGGKKKENGPEVSDWETGCLTFTSAFLLRRLLAAAERQKETPSDGRVHIIHLQDRSPPPGRCSHALAAKSPAHQSATTPRKKPEQAPMSESLFSRIEGGTEKKMKKKKIGAEFSPPSEEKKETLPSSHKKRH